MILPEFILTSRVNQHWQYSGMDSIENCLDKNWFRQYPYNIEYHYNSRGFRDNEWPESLKELKKSIWCLGDSFTVGLGSPIEHTWPYLLQKKTGIRTINVSMDGASNNWIARKTVDILQQIQPQYIVLHWSYHHRSESNDQALSDEDRRFGHTHIELKSAVQNFEKCVNLIRENNIHCQILHSFIPECWYPDSAHYERVWEDLAGPTWPKRLPDDITLIPNFVVNELTSVFNVWDDFSEYYEFNRCMNNILHSEATLGTITKLDRARDGYHYDVQTSRVFVKKIVDFLNLV